ncbi:MAG: hypothetical protein NTW28_16625, partial [Candidatus Solibacter sp.]|nr:hypothetical protein [Candidatus Solibacter sp.]
PILVIIRFTILRIVIEGLSELPWDIEDLLFVCPLGIAVGAYIPGAILSGRASESKSGMGKLCVRAILVLSGTAIWVGAYVWVQHSIPVVYYHAGGFPQTGTMRGPYWAAFLFGITVGALAYMKYNRKFPQMLPLPWTDREAHLLGEDGVCKRCRISKSRIDEFGIRCGLTP